MRARGYTGIYGYFDSVLHIELFGLAAYGVILLSEFTRDYVRELQAFGLCGENDIAAVEKFGKFLSAMLGHLLIAVQIEKANADSVGERKYRQVGFVAFDVNGVKSVHCFPLMFD